jgi:DNA-binding MarR family transcriptional regulator
MTLVTSGTMTNRLHHLEQRGLVRRKVDPKDARSVRVRLTAEGRRRVEGALKDLVVKEEALLRGLTDRQRKTLAGLLKIVVAPFDSP